MAGIIESYGWDEPLLNSIDNTSIITFRLSKDGIVEVGIHGHGLNGWWLCCKSGPGIDCAASQTQDLPVFGSARRVHG